MRRIPPLDVPVHMTLVEKKNSSSITGTTPSDAMGGASAGRYLICGTL